MGHRLRGVGMGCFLLCSLAMLGCGAEASAPPCPATVCHVVVPPCQTPALAGTGMPSDVASQVGFMPYVATWLPKAVYWYGAQPYPSTPSAVQLLPSQPRPLMRVEYAYDFPRPYNSFAPHTVIEFDETTQPLGLTQDMMAPGQALTVTSQENVTINGHAATYFEAQSSSAQDKTAVVGVEWQVGTLALRVTAVTSGRYVTLAPVDVKTLEVSADSLSSYGDDVLAWTGTNQDELLRVARGATTYTGCV